MPTLTELKQDIFDYTALRLGEGIVDLELDQHITKLHIKMHWVHTDNVRKTLLKKVTLG